MGERSRNHCCSGKATSITYSECVFVALCIQNAKRMSRIVFPCVSCQTLQYFSTLSHKRHDFLENRAATWHYVYGMKEVA